MPVLALITSSVMRYYCHMWCGLSCLDPEGSVEDPSMSEKTTNARYGP